MVGRHAVTWVTCTGMHASYFMFHDVYKVYTYNQWRIQDLAQGGDKSGAKRPKNFLSPPWAPQGGDRGGKGGDRIQDEGGKFCTILRFCTIYQMNLQENIEKKIFVPPLSHSGGGHFCCPPPELLRRGTILRGGTVPPLKLLRGGTVPYSPPLYPLLFMYV